MSSPRVRVSVVLPERNKVLLVRHRKGERKYWLLPGGGMEFGESIETCATREMLEETGLDIVVKRILCISETIAPDGSRHIFNVYVLARKVGGTLRCGDEEILDGAEFVDFAKLPSLTLYPPIGEYLLQLKAGRFRLPIKYLGCLWQP